MRFMISEVILRTPHAVAMMSEVVRITSDLGMVLYEWTTFDGVF